MDACFGDLVARLRADGLLDRAVLAVVGDHGESLGEHEYYFSHGFQVYREDVQPPAQGSEADHATGGEAPPGGEHAEPARQARGDGHILRPRQARPGRP